MRQEQLQPPRPSEHSISLDDEFRQLEAERKAEWIDEAMRGAGEFWSSEYDAEQEFIVFKLLQRVMAMPTLQDETRWQLLMTALREGEVAVYAERRCER